MLCLFSTALCVHAAQGPVSLRGTVENAGVEPLQVELVEASGRSPFGRALVSSGHFEFNGVAAGEYEVRLLDRRGDVVSRSLVSARSHVAEVEFRLPPPQQPAASRASTISLRRFITPPGKRAAKLFAKGVDAHNRGKLEPAVEHYRRALDEHPLYLEAMNNLGNCLLRLDRYSEAVEVLEQAIALDPDVALPHSNLASALLLQGRYEEARRAADHALRKDPRLPQAHYVAGLAYLQQHRTADALRHLKVAGESFAPARQLASRIERGSH
ncbi:MAG: tetratricopeptide repeat protein [Bryobacteraceae bacterium]|nr:tetratricopeptide repeat protein [Bryobacteraceae bacterium]